MDKQKEKPKFFRRLENYFANMNKADLFAFIIGCCAIGLVIIPEINIPITIPTTGNVLNKAIGKTPMVMQMTAKKPTAPATDTMHKTNLKAINRAVKNIKPHP